jgi:hypothetical protein
MVDILDKEFGKVDDYSDFDKVRNEVRLPAIYEFSPSYFTGKNEVINPVPDLIPPRAIDVDEKGAEMFDYNYYYRHKALKGLERTEPAKKVKDSEINKEKNTNI